MGLMDFFSQRKRGEKEGKERQQRPESLDAETGTEPIEGRRLSIYEAVKAAVTAEGLLPSSFSVPRKAPNKGQLSFADGAMDGILMYHMGPGEKDVEPLCQAVTLAAEGNFDEAEAQLERVFTGETFVAMISYIDGLQRWIVENKDQLPPEKLYEFAGRLLFKSDNIEIVKFALSLLELFNVEDSEDLAEAVRTLAMSDEFTLFCLFIMGNWSHGSAEIYGTARKVRGWGRIHAIERLEPGEDEEMKEWLLSEGFQNNVMPEYSAMECIEKGDLLGKLQKGGLSQQDLKGAGELIQISLSDGPVTGIRGWERGEELIRIYLQRAMDSKPSGVALNAVNAIGECISDFEWPSSDLLKGQCQEFLRNPQAEEILWEEVGCGRNLSLALNMGLDCSSQIYGSICSDFDHQYHNLGLLMSRGLYVDELISLYLEKLPLERMQTGPALELGVGPEFLLHNQLVYMVQFLKNYPQKGEELICCALLSPVISCRNMAMNVLDEWKSRGAVLSERLLGTVRTLGNSEVEEQLQQRIKTFLEDCR